jgi:hypothetical protein
MMNSRVPFAAQGEPRFIVVLARYAAKLPYVHRRATCQSCVTGSLPRSSDGDDPEVGKP